MISDTDNQGRRFFELGKVKLLLDDDQHEAHVKVGDHGFGFVPQDDLGDLAVVITAAAGHVRRGGAGEYVRDRAGYRDGLGDEA